MHENNKGETGAADGHNGQDGEVPQPPAVLVYATFPTPEGAVAAGRRLVEAKLSGCVNVIPGMISIYVWQGQTEQAAEAVLIAKMPAFAADRAVEDIRAFHPYETPAILVLPVTGGNAAYFDWLAGGVHPFEKTAAG